MQRWVDTLPWSGHDEFVTAPEEAWTVNGTAAGSVRTAKGLFFVKVALAGHMVPMVRCSSPFHDQKVAYASLCSSMNKKCKHPV